jgi:hypothetical protein
MAVALVRTQSAAQEQFERTKENDALKNKYAGVRGLKLVRIPHWDDIPEKNTRRTTE